MSFLELTEKRFSARKYTDEPVSEADLNYVLECVRLAPSAVNRQPWRFVVVESEAVALGSLRSRVVSFCSACHCLLATQGRVLDACCGREVSRWHRRSHRRGASLPRCRRAWTWDLLDLQLRPGENEELLRRSGLGGCRHCSVGSHRPRLSPRWTQAQGVGRNRGKKIETEMQPGGAGSRFRFRHASIRPPTKA